MSYDSFLSITSQCPPLSEPTRRTYPCDLSHVILFSIAVCEIPIPDTRSKVVTAGFCTIILIIRLRFSPNLSPNFSPNFFCGLSPVLFSPSTFDRTTLNHVSWFSNLTRTPPCLLQSSYMRFMPEPYRSVKPTALKSDANCGLRGLVT